MRHGNEKAIATPYIKSFDQLRAFQKSIKQEPFFKSLKQAGHDGHLRSSLRGSVKRVKYFLGIIS